MPKPSQRTLRTLHNAERNSKTLNGRHDGTRICVGGDEMGSREVVGEQKLVAQVGLLVDVDRARRRGVGNCRRSPELNRVWRTPCVRSTTSANIDYLPRRRTLIILPRPSDWETYELPTS